MSLNDFHIVKGLGRGVEGSVGAGGKGDICNTFSKINK